MSKIICDVCGTTYPETAAQCPICGCVRPGEAKVVSTNTSVLPEEGENSYTYVKGGRFSKSNVRKRNQNNNAVASASSATAKEDGEKKDGSEKGLTIAVIVLLLAIVAVVLYVVLRVFGPGLFSGITDKPTDNKGESTSESVELDVPCSGLTLATPVIELNKKDAAYLMDVTIAPADCTEKDSLMYRSADPNVATVDSEGKVTAVGVGETIITVTCGKIEVQCRVVCTFEEEPATDETLEQPSNDETVDTEDPSDDEEPAEDFKLNREDFTLSAKGTSWVLYNGSIAKTEITWTSDNENVATVEDGKVVGVGFGVTKVHAEYKGIKRTCIVRCSFSSSGSTSTDSSDVTTNKPEDNVTYVGPYKISHTDVTIAVGETFTLTLKDANGQIVNVAWRTSNNKCTVSGNVVKGVSPTPNDFVKVYVAYENNEYACSVRVKN